VAAARQDPKLEIKLQELVAESSYQRDDFVMKTGWATAPGADNPNRGVATACAVALTNLAKG
jgi:hypothetical protein